MADSRVGGWDRFRSAELTPLSADGDALQATISTRLHAKLRHAQDLFGPEVVPGDFDALLERSLDALIAEAETRKSARAGQPRERRTEPTSARTIAPARGESPAEGLGSRGAATAARAALDRMLTPAG